MILLSIETAQTHLGLGLYRVCSNSLMPLASVYREVPLRQSEELIPALDRVMKKAKVKKGDLDLLCVDIGPGSFTGIRVGLSCARGLAQGLKKPLVGVNALEAMVYEAFLTGKAKGLVCAVIPAVKGELYYGFFNWSDMRESSSPLLLEMGWKKEKELWNVLKKKRRFLWTLIGSRSTFPALKFHVPPSQWILHERGVHPKWLAEAAWVKFSSDSQPDRSFHYESAVPLYLQPSWAERHGKQ